MKRAIIIVLDSFGIGAMDDVASVRPQDLNTNTAKHLLEIDENIHWDTLLQLGLMNALGEEIGKYKKNPSAIYGQSNLQHEGGDTYFGHQEIMGTKPVKPVLNRFQEVIDEIEMDLKSYHYETVRIKKEGLEILCVNQSVFIGDNLETDLGQAINVTGSFDLASFEEIKEIGKRVRNHVQVSRVIAFGGHGVTLDDLTSAIEVKEGYIGVNAPKSKVYQKEYQVCHLGYGVDTSKQLPTILWDKKIKTTLYGKVADIVENPNGKNVYGVDTATLFHSLHEDLKKQETGFYCLNVQETDLAGHQCNPELYIDRMNVSDQGIKEVLSLMSKNDLLIVMADHGNDPTVKSTKHSREKVPLLIHFGNHQGIDCGTRETLADVGATVAEYFETQLPNGVSFLKIIESNQ